MPSRRSCLATLATVVAGCSTGPGSPSSDGSTDPPDSSSTRTSPGTSSRRSPSDEVEPLPADDPALGWAVRLPESIQRPPAIDRAADRVYVGAGDPGLGRSGVDRSATGVVFGLHEADGTEAWRAPTEAPVLGTPVVDGGAVHVVTGHSTGFRGVDNRIVAYGSDGTRRWRTGPRGKFVSIVAAHGGTVYAGTSDDALDTTGETLFAVAPGGDVRWSRGAGDARAATVADGSLLYSQGGLELGSFALADGAEEWQAAGKALGNPTAEVTTVEGLCYTQPREKTDERYPIVARSTADGSEQWRYSIPPEDDGNFVPTGVAALPTSVGGVGAPGLVGSEYAGAVFALDVDGTERWRFAADARTSQPVVGDAVYVGDADGTVYALDPGDGGVRWRASLPRFPRIRPLADGVLAVSSEEGGSVLAAIGSDGGERWRYSTSEDLAGHAIAGGRVYAGATDGTLYAFAV